MSQQSAFLAAVRDDPDDDLHRLAWADWLDDHGDTRRADFIRAQVRLAALSEGDPARDALEDEADDLLEGHDREWAGPVAEIAQEWAWHRGCVERVTVWGDPLLSRGDELFAAAPVRELRLLAEASDMPRLAGRDFLRHVAALDLSRNPAGDESAAAGPFHRDRPLQQLFVSPHLSRLRVVRAQGQGVERPLVQTLVATGLFRRLEVLDLMGNNALGDGAARLLAGERSHALAALDVRQTNVTHAGLSALLDAPSWPALRRLEFNANLLTRHGTTPATFWAEWLHRRLVPQLTSFHAGRLVFDASGVRPLLDWEGAERLEELDLVGCGLGAAAAEEMAASGRLGALRRLDLSMNPVRDSGARALAGSPGLAGLTSLRLAGASLGGPGIRALAASPVLSRLRSLSLDGNVVGESGVEALASMPARLRELSLVGGGLRPAEAGRLVSSPSLGRLRVLVLNDNSLGDAAVVALAASPALRRLRRLHLDSCGLGDGAARALAESPHLGRLKRLSLRNTFVTGRERGRIEARFGAAARF